MTHVYTETSEIWVAPEECPQMIWLATNTVRMYHQKIRK